MILLYKKFLILLIRFNEIFVKILFYCIIDNKFKKIDYWYLWQIKSMMVYKIAHAYKVAFPIYVTKITYIIRLMINITFINKHTKYIKKKISKR